MNTIGKKVPTVARYLLGTIFFVFGLNGFLQFLPAPPLEGNAGALMAGFAASGYMFPLIKGTEVLVGLALLSNRFVPLSLLVLAPITINILAFHAILAPAGLVLPIVVLAAHLAVAYGYRDLFRPLLQARVEASDAPQSDRRGHTAHAAA
jgi:uncharacterized membrane protein YphA (DoxX/SURF4 family)